MVIIIIWLLDWLLERIILNDYFESVGYKKRVCPYPLSAFYDCIKDKRHFLF